MCLDPKKGTELGGTTACRLCLESNRQLMTPKKTLVTHGPWPSSLGLIQSDIHHSGLGRRGAYIIVLCM